MDLNLPRRLLTALVVTALFLAGCGGDDGEDTASTSAPTTVASPTTAPPTTEPERASTDPARAEQARSAVLRIEDFPAGWKVEPEAQLNIETVWRELTRCLGVESTGPALGIATSPPFLRGLATQTRSTVEYMAEAEARNVAAALAGPNFTRCMTEAFAADAKRAAPEGATPSPVEVSPLEFPALAPQTSASRINVRMVFPDGFEVPIFQDFLVFVDGGTVTRMFFLNPGGPFPPNLERELVEKVLARA